MNDFIFLVSAYEAGLPVLPLANRSSHEPLTPLLTATITHACADDGIMQVVMLKNEDDEGEILLLLMLLMPC